MKINGRKIGLVIASLLLAVLAGACIGIVARGMTSVPRNAKDVYAAFLATDPDNYSLDGRLDVRMSITGGGGEFVTGIPATVSIGFSDHIVDHEARGSTSMRISVLDVDDGYDLESYVSLDDTSFSTYSRARPLSGEWGDWAVQDGYMLTLDSRALFRGAYLLSESVTASDGIYTIPVRPREVWDAVGLANVIASLAGTESVDRTAYLAAASSSRASYEISESTGRLTAVDADGFSLEVDGTVYRAAFRVEFSGYGSGSVSDVSVPGSVLASAVSRQDGPFAPLLDMPGGRIESIIGISSEDVSGDTWSDQFSGDYGFDVVKYDDGTWHVLDMDGNEIEGAEAYDDGRVYHPDYGWIYPDYETDNG